MKKTKEQNQKGITLISLVITIILLLILATVAISLAVDSDGLFSKAGEAANKWNTSVADEQTTLQNLIDMAENVSKVNPVSKYVTEESTGRTAPIPTGYVVSQIPGEDTITGGLVIYEGTQEVTGTKGSTEHENAMTTRNQYVWIPVDDINDMVMCQECGGDVDLNIENLQCPTHGEETKLAGKTYWNQQNWVFDEDATGQIYNANSGNREPGVLADVDGATENYHGYGTAAAFLVHMQEEFNNMAESVAKYKGFYISRYEIGNEGISQKGKQVLSNTGEINWYTLYKTLEGKGISTNSQMMWGCQYDQVIKFIGNDAKVSHNEVLAKIAAETGNNSSDIMNNIYDLEGNYMEWTEEAATEGSYHFRVTRGSYYFYVNRGFNNSASYWDNGDNDPLGSYENASTRAALFVQL